MDEEQYPAKIVAGAASGPKVNLGVVLAFVAGLVLAGGLVYSGLTQPKRVIGFLDLSTMLQGRFPGRWNPAWGIAVLSAVAVMLLAYWLARRPGAKPWLAPKFSLPRRNSIDFKLVIGSAIFGVGWGLSGYCPGPALASLMTGSVDVVIFVITMCLGMLFAKPFSRMR